MILRTFLAALLLLATAHVQGQVPRTIDYQGYLTTAGGVPVNASLSISFALYEEPAGGMALWTETQTVPVNNGNYHVALGSVSTLVLPFDRPYYLGLTVGGDDEMLPRHPLSSAPYALRAGCNPGDMVSCYDGPEGTLHVGACKAGVRVCNAAGTAYGPCTAQVVPVAEVCGNSVDENCNGQLNDGCGAPTCTVGQQKVCGMGVCQRSVQCTTGYDVCTPGVPMAELCNNLDDDCDGGIDEDFPTKGTTCFAEGPQPGICVAGTYVCSITQQGVQCSVPGTACPDDSAAVPGQIAAARTSGDGPASLPIHGAVVTALKPSLGVEPAGFFVQGLTINSPALFVAVDPTTLTPPLIAGDRISFTITSMGTVGGLRQATAITGLLRLSQGLALAVPVQNVSAAVDLVSNVTSYESELINITGVISSAFAASGAGYSAASFITAGVSTGLQLRLPSTLVASMDLGAGCAVTLPRAQMWRLNEAAQVSAWAAAAFQSVACPSPTVLGATALSSSSVRVTFDRLINPASASPYAGQFTIGGLGITASAVNGKEVTLTTEPQTPGAPYIVTVSTAFVEDIHGTNVNPAANTAAFTGFVP